MQSNTGLTRAFIALELPSTILSELASIQKLLQRQFNCPAKWVACNNIHLTLSFLGEIPPEALENAKQSVSEATTGQNALNLSFDRLGAFPNMIQPRIVWVGLNGELAGLISLQTKLDQLLRRRGLSLEERRFSPHLTLARIRDEASPSDRQLLGQTLSSTKINQAHFSARSISLIKSLLTPYGPSYSTLFRAELH